MQPRFMLDDHASARRRSPWALGAVLVILGCGSSARADEAKGCDAVKWPRKQEGTVLQAAAAKPSPTTDAPALADGTAYNLALVPLAAAHLPQPPEHKPKMDPSKAGYLRFGPPGTAGPFQIAISQAAWIDIVQDGTYIKPTAFSGASDCPGVRKSIRFKLAPAPFTVQISGTAASSIALLVEAVPTAK